jgi:hypothetical protein
MKADLITTKVTKETLKLIKKIAAETGYTQYEVVDGLVREEAELLGLIPVPKKKKK